MELRSYEEEDLIKIRDFLVSSYARFGGPYNWTIERWNFAYTMDRVMHDVSLDEWKERIGIWEENDDIIGIVTSEGDGNHAFIQVRDREPSNVLLREMFDFIDENLLQEDVNLRIPNGAERIERMAEERGYQERTWREAVSGISLKEFPEEDIPEGFEVKTGDEISDEEKGKAHASAFGYFGEEEAERTPKAYEVMREAPDYDAELDLYLVSEEGDIASFCTVWYDEKNRISFLEPVGTPFAYRRQGLAAKLVSRALKTASDKGAEKAYVSSTLDFYRTMGFEIEFFCNVWKKER